MAIKKFLKLYVVICIGILCFPLLGLINTTSGAEVIGNELENRSVDQPLVAVNDVQHDWNSWSSVENASDVNPGSHDIILASNTAESHAKAGAESASHQSEVTGAVATALEDFLELAKYGKAIHVMAMLMVGFGFLMVFVRRYVMALLPPPILR